MTRLFNLAFAAYLAALVAAVIGMIRRGKTVERVVYAFLAAGVLLLSAYMGVRWTEAGRAPFSNMFESLILFGWAIPAIFLALLHGVRIPGLSAATALASVLTLAYASTFSAEIRPLMPALQSNWLTFHVFSCFLGYGGFAVSFLASLGYLVVSRRASQAPKRSRAVLDTAMSQTISFGFLFLTVGIVTGSIWANSAWGSYWSWDPKETWSLITWLVYAAFLHCRYMRGWSGRRAAWISIVGFASVLFTYVGVNFLLSGLHSYA